MNKECTFGWKDSGWLIFLLAPLFSNFSLPVGISAGDLFMIGFFIYWLIKYGLIKSTLYKVLCVLIVSIGYLGWYFTNFQEGSLSLLRMSIYLLIGVYFFGRKDIPVRLLRIYSYIVIVFSVLLVFQWISYQYFGRFFVYFDFPFDVEKSSLLITDLSSSDFRTGGVFREPSYFGIFVAPALLYAAIFRKYLLWVFVSLTVFLSTSALGLFFVLVSIFYFSNFNLKYLFFVFACAFLLIFILLQVEMIPERFVETLSGGGSFSIRILDAAQEVFGSSKNLFLPNIDLLQQILSGSDIWLNSAYYIFTLFGLMSVFLILLVLTDVNFMFLIYVLSLIFFTSVLSSPYFICFVVLLNLIASQCKKDALTSS